MTGKEETGRLADVIHRLLRQRDWAAARDALARYVDVLPNDPKAWYLRAFVEWALDSETQADAYVTRALRISPHYRRALELKERLARDSASALSDQVDLDSKTFLGPGPDRADPAPAPSQDTSDRAAAEVQDTIPLAAPEPAVRIVGGRYRLDTLVGSGGMGHVWKASDLRLHDRTVAVKRIHPHLLSAPDALARFQREVKALAGLNHPYIVGVLDSGRDEEGCYCVMEYAHGATLREWLGRHEPPDWPPCRDVLTIFTQVCRAVAFAHSRGIIHRDLKPENVVIAPDRAVQILDFGLASCVSEQGMTQAGKVVGTPLYMAPEQLRGELPDPRWDVYALGVVLFELLTLRRPFEGDNWLDVVRRREQEPPPDLRRYREDLPGGIETVVRKALCRDAGARHGSPRDLVSDAQKVLTAALPTRHTPDNERVLHHLAEAAWLDGVVTDREREFLLERAAELGIPRGRAREVVAAAEPQKAPSGEA